MGKQTGAEKRFNANRKFDSMCNNYIDKRKYYDNFYNCCIKNRGKDLKELLEILNSTLNENFTKETIGKKLGEMNNNYSSDKSTECLYILNLGNAISNSNMEKIAKYNKLLTEIEKKKAKNKERAKQAKEEKIKKFNNNVNVQPIKDLMNKVLNDEDISEYSHDHIYNLIVLGRKNINKIDQEEWINFLIKYYKLNTYTKEELEQLRETVSFFVENSKKNSDKLDGLNLAKQEDVDTLNNMNISGMESLDEMTMKYPKRLLAWKKLKLSKINYAYSMYLDMLNSLLDDEDFTAYRKLSTANKNNLDFDYEFLKTYIKEFKAISDCYISNIKNIYSTNDDNHKKLIKNFKKHIIKENNNE